MEEKNKLKLRTDLDIASSFLYIESGRKSFELYCSVDVNSNFPICSLVIKNNLPHLHVFPSTGALLFCMWYNMKTVIFLGFTLLMSELYFSKPELLWQTEHTAPRLCCFSC